ncbi:unnamed protein product [Nezara viridula]|uniref:UBX domain-containing protein n=1 Tax=Nezara viridula TaxID=85310 RepID=A0A9P0E350_NEZVI|nr:unnamed protein product [Nezara viridula]
MKKFVEEKKRQLKFKLAGPGHRLASDGAGSSSDDPNSASLNAALQRSEKQQSDQSKGSSSKQPKKIPTESSSAATTSLEEQGEKDPQQISNRIFFTCPELDDGVYPMKVWMEKARSYIQDKKTTDRVEAAILAIKTLNPENEVQFAMKVLQKYVANLINHPDEEKYKVIRLGNPNIQKLMSINGAVDFLLAIGFDYKNVSFDDENEHKEETYFVHITREDLDLNSVLGSLESVKGLSFVLDRNVKIFVPGAGGLDEEPDEFYEWTVYDMKKESKYRKNESERNKELRTRKMRGEPKIKPQAEYTFIRVRLPEGTILQATFATSEKLVDLREFLISKIPLDYNFVFVLLPAKNFEESEEYKSFLELDLYPSVTLMIKSCSEQES